jgi:hypothetical protein
MAGVLAGICLASVCRTTRTAPFAALLRSRTNPSDRGRFRAALFCLAQDVRDLTYWRVEYWDAGYEILRHSHDADLADRYEAGQHRVPDHT